MTLRQLFHAFSSRARNARAGHEDVFEKFRRALERLVPPARQNATANRDAPAR